MSGLLLAAVRYASTHCCSLPAMWACPLGEPHDVAEKPSHRHAHALQMVAVLQFSGYAVREAAESARQRLIQALEYGEHSCNPLLLTSRAAHELASLQQHARHVAALSIHALCIRCALHEGLCLLPSDGIALGDEEQSGVFRLAQYGQIYSLSSRLNELMLRVSV